MEAHNIWISSTWLSQVFIIKKGGVGGGIIVVKSFFFGDLFVTCRWLILLPKMSLQFVFESIKQLFHFTLPN